MNIAPEIDDLLRICLQLANELISFRRHRVYLRKNGSQILEEGMWKFADGFIPLADWPGNSRYYQVLFDELQRGSDPIRRETPSERGPECCARLQIGVDVEGLILIRRGLHGSEFTDIEAYHLRLIVALLTQAFQTEEPRTATRMKELLRRLHMVFLDLRDFTKQLFSISDSPNGLRPYEQAKEILGEYMRQARFVCLPHRFDRAVNVPSQVKVRTAGRLVRPDGKALWTAVADTRRSVRDECTEEDWGNERRERYFNMDDPDSITASVYESCRPYRTNSYSSDDWPTYKLFQDTSTLMLAPIVAAAHPCLGVLTIESTENESLGEAEEVAFTLLAGHAAWPLAEALHREELTRRENGDRIVDLEREKMLTLATWEEIRQRVQEGFQSLGFHRGFFATVQDKQGMKAVIGNPAWSWGDDRIKEVAHLTVRPYEQYGTDCQVIVATTGQPMIIQAPREHPHVEPKALLTGALQPFGIFPLVDSHGISRWTVHLEREDAAPIRGYERDLIIRLCRAAMASWEDARNRQFEQQWIEQMIAYSARTLPSMRGIDNVLQDFLGFLRKNEITMRGRIFTNLAGIQTCIMHFGEYPTETNMTDYPLQCLSETSQAVLTQLRLKRGEPLIVVQPSAEQELRNRGEFSIYHDPDATYMAEFGKVGLMEWIEAGVYREDEMVWKVVLDHKGCPDDRFALSEMRLINQMVRTLSWMITRIDAEHLRSELCIDGAIRALKRHQLRNEIDRVARDLGGRFLANFERAIRKDVVFGLKPPIAILVWILNKMLRGRLADKILIARESVIAEFRSKIYEIDDKLDPIGQELSTARFARFSDVFKVVQEIMETSRGQVAISYPDFSTNDPFVPGEGLALCLILLIVIQNAVDASDQEPHQIQADFDAPRGLVSVRDWGHGLPPEVIAEFKMPPRILDRQRGHGLGLVVARLLARELRWDLTPDENFTGQGARFLLRMKG